jgi:trimeric autotransporter adhesin
MKIFISDTTVVRHKAVSNPLLQWLVISAFCMTLALAGRVQGQDIRTVAGGGTPTDAPTKTELPGPTGVVSDSKGNVYVTAPQSDYVFELSTSHLVSVVAGLGWGHYNNNVPEYNGIAKQIPVYNTSGVTVDKYNRVYIADTTNNTIRMIYEGNITTVAGARQPCILKLWPDCYGGKSHNALYAYLNGPQGVVLDNSENIYIADSGDNVIRCVLKVLGACGDTTEQYEVGDMILFAGNYNNGVGCSPSSSPCGDGGPATGSGALLNHPEGISIAGNGDIYIADTFDNRIRCVTAAAGGCGVSSSQPHYIYTVAGTGNVCTSNNTLCGDGGPATEAEIGLPKGVSVNQKTGSVYIADSEDNRIRVVSAGTINNFAGTPNQAGYSGDGGPATKALLDDPAGVFFRGGEIYIADTGNQRIRCVATYSGGCGVSGSPAGNIHTILGSTGNGAAGSGGDGGSAKSALLAGPFAVAVDSKNNYYIADWANNRIRVVNTGTETVTIATVSVPAGAIETIAGNGDFGYSGDGDKAKNATMKSPYGVAVDTSGNIFIADTFNAVIREVNAATGVITTVPGTLGPLSQPMAVAVDANDNVFIPDLNKQVVFEASGGTVSIFAGNGSACPKPTQTCGDGGAATAAELNQPTGVAVAGNGDVFIADSFDNRIRCVAGVASTGCRKAGVGAGVIVTYAYTGSINFSGDGGPATQATRWMPKEVALDSGENLFIGGGHDYLVQRVDYFSGDINTFAGNDNDPTEFGYTGDGGLATKAEMNNMGLAIDSKENLLIADLNNNRIREVPLPGGLRTDRDRLDFGGVGRAQSQSLTVTFESRGGEALDIGEVLISGAEAGDFSQNSNCVAASADRARLCSVSVAFHPSAIGQRAATLAVIDKSGISHTVPLSGDGI